MAEASARAFQGQIAYHAGAAAEDSVARDYQKRGFSVLETRWRCDHGEIDLIVQDADRLVFVEVKKSRRFGTAARSLRPRQMQRIYATAEAFLGSQPAGSLTEARFDVALVDGTGAVHIIENAFGEGG